MNYLWMSTKEFIHSKLKACRSGAEKATKIMIFYSNNELLIFLNEHIPDLFSRNIWHHKNCTLQLDSNSDHQSWSRATLTTKPSQLLIEIFVHTLLGLFAFSILGDLHIETKTICFRVSLGHLLYLKMMIYL